MQHTRFGTSTLAPLLLLAFACGPNDCSGRGGPTGGGGSGGGATGGNGTGGGIAGAGGSPVCDFCTDKTYTPCDPNGAPDKPVLCPGECAPGKGCVACIPGAKTCVGNEVHECTADGQPGGVVETCDVGNGLACSGGECKSACAVAADQPSNVGCEFWAVDLDQQDALNDPASAPWGIALSNVGQSPANITIEINNANPGEPLALSVVDQLSLPPGTLLAKELPTRELDCGIKPNDYASPGTCLSSKAYRISSSAPIVVYQFNVFTNAYSNDASLLLPTNALGNYYRILGWGAGHPVKLAGFKILDRSYVTIVGTKPNTQVSVQPSWRIKGNPPIAATPAGGNIEVTLGPFDVLNLETDDGTFQDDPATMADLSGTFVKATQPIAVFSGVETAGAPGVVDIPKPPGWMDGDACCLDHLEDQMFPLESIGSNYVIPRSPVRSTGSFHEPDVIRFVGAAEPANVTTNLAPPFNQFTIQPGEVKTTWTQTDMTVQSDKPVMVSQILVSNQYCDGAYIGDPSLTVYPPVEQFRTEYIILTPGSWDKNYIVIEAEVGSSVSIDGSTPAGCTITPSGTLNGKSYESRVCLVQEGVHSLTGDKPYGIVAYGYGSAGSYAFVGGADVRRIYEPPIPE